MLGKFATILSQSHDLAAQVDDAPHRATLTGAALHLPGVRSDIPKENASVFARFNFRAFAAAASMAGAWSCPTLSRRCD